MIDVIFLGYVVKPEEANTATGASVAGNKMQWNVIKNMSERDDMRIHCVTVTPLAAFPHDNKLWQGRQQEQLTDRVISTRIPFINLPVIKQFWQTISVYIEAKRLLNRYPNAVIMAFNLFPQVGTPLRWLSRNSPTVCLLADLPIDDNTNRHGWSLLLRQIFERLTWKNMKACEKYIVLNPNVMKKYLPDKQYIVVDGGIDSKDSIHYSAKKDKIKEKNILFSGALTEYNGILELLGAMEKLTDLDIKLDIYGSGYLEEVVKQKSENSSNIRYHGRVSNEEVMQKQSEAWMLINPRRIDDPIAQVTFPSKTFEYMLSGTPIISTRLNGYGPEYEDTMFWIDESTDEAIADKIRSINLLSPDVIEDVVENAFHMVTHKKLWSIQCERIAAFVLNQKGKIC